MSNQMNRLHMDKSSLLLYAFIVLTIVINYLLYFYCIAYVPRLQSTEFSILGLGFSEKSWTYLLGLQLSLSQGFRSLLPSLIGLLFGYLYIKNLLLMQKFRLPKFLEVCFLYYYV